MGIGVDDRAVRAAHGSPDVRCAAGTATGPDRALGQRGVGSRHDSAIATDSSLDRFSAADVAAMRLASGCRDAAVPALGAAG